MPRVKIARKSTATDMTAMCDVAFLLLTFFIMTSKFKADDPVPVAIPSYTHTIVLPEENTATLTVGHGKVFFSVEGDKIRASMLEQVGQLYNVTFTPQEKAMFITLPTFGMPIGSLKGYLDQLINEPEKAKSIQQPGIPTDSVSNELFNWVREARKADAALNGKSLLICIKGDKKEEYPTIGKIIAILQKQKVNKFSLITASRGM
ncbi:biopolymer transporter ExbD [Mucilaginibacter sp. PPCGB 2223]|uniref:ExbD/TolR family protein n=1 Tax=Mucilaginibacter sp. PPCGB 2223 TaxID=1886027 RepID=UPI000825DD8D|nr:biopolymer transporter ExbD [Mucilaginibacter sp. PPCGB 2223]OCX50623.1 biopolymer transporter ExbD [Mucilaginibacter sp. PPCGB 2223]